MKNVILVFSILIASSGFSKNIELGDLSEHQIIDRKQPTLLILHEPAYLSLESPLMSINPVAESDGSSIWKLNPRCKNKCKKNKAKAEFVLSSGSHLVIHFLIQEGVSDHALVLKGTPQKGSINAVRTRVLPKARRILLETIKGWPQRQKIEREIPDFLSSLAESWSVTQTEDFYIFQGEPSYAKRVDIESLHQPQLILAGQDQKRLIVISRREP